MPSSTGQPPPHASTTKKPVVVSDSDRSRLDECRPSTSSMADSRESEESTATTSNSNWNDRKNAVRQVYSFFLDALITNTVVKCHRDIALNEAVGVSCRDETEMPSTPVATPPNGPSTSSNVQPTGAPKRQIECICYTCKRVIAASRLAPHLEKCIGLGRNSSRVARKRLAHYAGVSGVSMASTPSASSSPRVRQASNTTDTMEAESVGDLDDVEWTTQSFGDSDETTAECHELLEPRRNFRVRRPLARSTADSGISLSSTLTPIEFTCRQPTSPLLKNQAILVFESR